MSNLSYRSNVCMVVRKSQSVLLGCRIDRHHRSPSWQLPQGGVEGEDGVLPADSPLLTLEIQRESVFRELEEELGMEKHNLRIITKLDFSYSYDFDRIPSYAVGTWRGQKQTYWLVDYLGTDEEIVLDKHHQEFSAWKWVHWTLVIPEVHPIRRSSYHKIFQELNEKGYFS